VLPLGDAALAVELGDGISPEVAARVRALDLALARDPPPGLRESVPTYRSLLVLFDPGALPFADMAALLQRQAAGVASIGAPPPGPLRRVPVRYGGEDGPDLAEVARARGLTPAEVVALHSGREYTAYMLGFRPGFAYLGLLPPELETPRLATPRVRVPAGSVGIAGRQTGVYPWVSPGGWSLLGRTAVPLFDAAADPPSLIQPGDRVRFDPVDELRAPPERRVASPAAEPWLEVLDGGLLTTVQDEGRPGYRRVGVSTAGALDAPALRRANAAVGNPPAAAGLECTVAGPTLRFLRPTRFALAGADLGAVLERADLGPWPVPPGRAVLARTGNVLSFTGRRSGCRAYLAFAGGLAVPLVLGSRGTDLGAGFGGWRGRALLAGDVLGLGPPGREPAVVPEEATPEAEDEAVVRVVLGPQADHFPPSALERFLGEAWRVGPSSDRTGCRLAGPALEHAGPTEIVSDGMVPGAVQVPPDGQPIVMLADGPTTGGYPKVAAVVSADLPRLAQLLPGRDRIRFTVWHRA
jgi:KipI family sensor histidine kinase inhibitor